jgi:4-amino-4-deoxy-L-arabinose transferase-like glycosyltransferase
MPNTDRVTHKQLLLLIILIAVLVRILAALYMGDQVTALPGVHDQISYDALARSLRNGEGYRFSKNWYPFTPADTPTAHWSFLYPLYLAGVYALTGYHPLAARLLQGIVGGILISLLIFHIGRRVVGERAALIGAGLAAIYVYFVYYNAALMTETFFIVTVLLTLLISLELKEQPSLVGWILLGLALGVAALLRQTVLLFVPFLLFWLLWELKGRIQLWHLAVPIGVVVLLIIPWTIRNYQVYHQFLPLNSNAGYAFYASNHPALGTNWRYESDLVPVPLELEGLNEAEMNQALMRRGMQFVLEDPGRYFLLTLDKTLEYFKFWPSSQSSGISNVSRVLSFGLYMPFMLLGLLLSLPRWRRCLPLYLFVVIHTGIHLLSWPAPRYRLPVDAILMPFAGLAVLELERRLGSWRKTRVYSESP